MDRTETEYEFFFEWEMGDEAVDLVVYGKKGRDYPSLIDYQRDAFFPEEIGEFEIVSVRRQGETGHGAALTDDELTNELIEAIEDHFWNVIHY